MATRYGVIDKGRGIKSVNNGEIEIKGDNTIGIFVRDSTASNNGKISVMKNSSGMYAIYDEANYGDGELQIINENSGNIKIGENSTFAYLDGSATTNLKPFFNDGTKRIDTNNWLIKDNVLLLDISFSSPTKAAQYVLSETCKWEDMWLDENWYTLAYYLKG